MLPSINLFCDLGGFRFEFFFGGPNYLAPDRAGLYVFLRPAPAANQWFIDYIGRAVSLRDRFADHDRWAEAQRRGVTQVGIYVPVGLAALQDLDDIERRLIQFYNPPMNTQHRTAPSPQWSDLVPAPARGLGSAGNFFSSYDPIDALSGLPVPKTVAVPGARPMPIPGLIPLSALSPSSAKGRGLGEIFDTSTTAGLGAFDTPPPPRRR